MLIAFFAISATLFRYIHLKFEEKYEILVVGLKVNTFNPAMAISSLKTMRAICIRISQ
jgi:hypothetical protein